MGGAFGRPRNSIHGRHARPPELGHPGAEAPACRRRGERRSAATAAKDKASRDPFLWPTPPYASYPAPSEQTETLPCQVVTGAEHKVTSARLTFFVPETAVAHLQMPPARTTVPLRFDQFTALIADDAAAAAAAAAVGPARRAAAPSPEQPVQGAAAPAAASWKARRSATSRPTSASSSSRPAATTAASSACSSRAAPMPSFEIGRRSARCWSSSSTRPGSRSARRWSLQDEMRSQKIGDILVTKQIVSPEQLLEAIERSTRCRWCASARRCCRSAWSAEEQLEEALVAAAARPQRAARRGAGAHGHRLARRPADRAGPQDGLPARRPRRLPGRGRGAAQAQLRRRRAPAGDAAPDPRGPPRRRPRRPVAPRRARRDRVQRRHEGRAGARPEPVASRPRCAPPTRRSAAP